MDSKKKQQRILAIILIFLLLIGTSILINQFVEGESYFEYTEEDVKMLGDFMEAEIIWAKENLHLENEDSEAPKELYVLVGSVVLHRLESRYWGETMQQVIYAPHQYEVIWGSEIMKDIETPPKVYEWAEELLRYGPKGPEGLIYETYFKRGDDEPYQEVWGIYFYVEERITKRIEGGKVN